MAVVYRCDRCRYESDDAANIGQVSADGDVALVQLAPGLALPIKRDLCAACLRALRDYLLSLPQVERAR